MVEVFKTNIDEQVVAEEILQLLRRCFPGARINFDLLDCDNILRVEAQEVDGGEVMQLLKAQGYCCEMLA